MTADEIYLYWTLLWMAVPPLFYVEYRVWRWGIREIRKNLRA